MKDIVQIGSTVESFVERFVEDWFKENPNNATLRDIYAEISGMIRWHKIIGSTPPAWFGIHLAAKINKAMTEHEAKANPWAQNVIDRGMSVIDAGCQK